MIATCAQGTLKERSRIACIQLFHLISLVGGPSRAPAWGLFYRIEGQVKNKPVYSGSTRRSRRLLVYAGNLRKRLAFGREYRCLLV